MPGDRAATAANNPWVQIGLFLTGGTLMSLISTNIDGSRTANEKIVDRLQDGAEVMAGIQQKQQELCDRTTRLEAAEIEQQKINAQLLAEVARLKQAMRLN